ncbi:MAG: hypothetical protein AB7G21_12845 [Dehalococcoidia bacterium]
MPTLGRLRRLALLDLRVLDEVRADAAATLPAVLVAVVNLALLGLGGWLWWVMSGLGDRWGVLLKSVVLGTGFAAAAWIVWLIVATVVLNRLTRTALDVGALLRAAGFATLPLAIALLMAARPVAFGVGVTALAAWVATTQVALQRASGRTGSEVLVANLAGFAAWAVIMSLLASATNQTAPGPFLAESIWEAVTRGRVTFQP